jgi:hypothetical protein
VRDDATTVTLTDAVTELAGEDGRDVELQATETYIQWRYVGESWTNLISLASIT